MLGSALFRLSAYVVVSRDVGTSVDLKLFPSFVFFGVSCLLKGLVPGKLKS